MTKNEGVMRYAAANLADILAGYSALPRATLEEHALTVITVFVHAMEALEGARASGALADENNVAYSARFL